MASPSPRLHPLPHLHHVMARELKLEEPVIALLSCLSLLFNPLREILQPGSRFGIRTRRQSMRTAHSQILISSIISVHCCKGQPLMPCLDSLSRHQTIKKLSPCWKNDLGISNKSFRNTWTYCWMLNPWRRATIWEVSDSCTIPSNHMCGGCNPLVCRLTHMEVSYHRSSWVSYLRNSDSSSAENWEAMIGSWIVSCNSWRPKFKQEKERVVTLQ